MCVQLIQTYKKKDLTGSTFKHWDLSTECGKVGSKHHNWDNLGVRFKNEGSSLNPRKADPQFSILFDEMYTKISRKLLSLPDQKACDLMNRYNKSYSCCRSSYSNKLVQ